MGWTEILIGSNVVGLTVLTVFVLNLVPLTNLLFFAIAYGVAHFLSHVLVFLKNIIQICIQISIVVLPV